MAATTEFYQGDSSDILAVKVKSAGVVLEDLDGFTGKFSVVKCLGDEPLIEQDMVVVDNEFRAQIEPEDSEDLAPGSYIGVAEIENATLPFRKETHIKITVKKQGYTA